MTLGDVLPAIQQGAIDGAVTGMGPVAHTSTLIDAAKFVTMTDQPAIFIIAEINKNGTNRCRRTCSRSSIRTRRSSPWPSIRSRSISAKQAEDGWTAAGGEVIKLPPDEQATLMKTLSSVGADVSNSNPELAAAYKISSRRGGSGRRQSPSQ